MNQNAKNYEVYFPKPPLAALDSQYFPTAELTLRFVKKIIAGITPFKFEDLLVSKPYNGSFDLSKSEVSVESLEELEKLAYEERFKVELLALDGSLNFNDWDKFDYRLAGMAVFEVNDYIKANNLTQEVKDGLITRDATLYTAGKEIPLTFEELLAIYKLETKSE
jgi:hypothetical protein